MTETLYPLHARIEPETTIHSGDVIETKIALVDAWETVGRYRAYRAALKVDARMPKARSAIFNRNRALQMVEDFIRREYA